MASSIDQAILDADRAVVNVGRTSIEISSVRWCAVIEESKRSGGDAAEFGINVDGSADTG